MRAAENLKTDENGVELLTIHRSKGLEFNTVYILGAADGSIPMTSRLRRRDRAIRSARRRKTASVCRNDKGHASIYMYLVPRTGGEKQRATKISRAPSSDGQTERTQDIKNPADHCRVLLT